MFLLFNVIIGIAYGVVLVILDLEESRFWRNLYPLLVFPSGPGGAGSSHARFQPKRLVALCPVANLVFACFEEREAKPLRPRPKATNAMSER